MSCGRNGHRNQFSDNRSVVKLFKSKEADEINSSAFLLLIDLNLWRIITALFLTIKQNHLNFRGNQSN